MTSHPSRKPWGKVKLWSREGSAHSVLMGLSLLSTVLQTCQASHVNFLVCVLCLQALVVPPSAELSAPFLTSGVRWRGGSHAGTITLIDHGGGGRQDIKGVCHANVPRARGSCFSFQFLFTWHTLSRHSHPGASVSGSVHPSYRWESVTATLIFLGWMYIYQTSIM